MRKSTLDSSSQLDLWNFKLHHYPRSGLLGSVLGVLFGREFAGIDVAFVQLRILLPSLGQVIQRKNRRNGADGNACAAIDAFHGINVELWNVVECCPAVVIGRVLLGVYA